MPLAWLCWLGLLSTSPALAQTSIAPSIPYPSTELPLYNGYAYDLPADYLEGHPWLLEPWQPGVVCWRGDSIPVTRLRYDLQLDQLIGWVDTNGFQVIRWEPLFVSGFRLDHRVFTQLAKVSFADTIAVPEELLAGYVEIAWQQDSGILYTKHRKELQELSRANRIDWAFRLVPKHYVYRRGHFTRIRGQQSLRRAFPPEKRPLLRQALRRAQLRVRKASSMELASILLQIYP